jgi:hypothetical protein
VTPLDFVAAVAGFLLLSAVLLSIAIWVDMREPAKTLIQCEGCRHLTEGDRVRFVGHAPFCPRCVARAELSARAHHRDVA